MTDHPTTDRRWWVDSYTKPECPTLSDDDVAAVMRFLSPAFVLVHDPNEDCSNG